MSVGLMRVSDQVAGMASTHRERLRSGVGVGPVPESAKPAEGEWVELRPRWPLGDLDERCSQQRQKIKSAKTRGIKMSLTQETALLAAAKKARLQDVDGARIKARVISAWRVQVKGLSEHLEGQVSGPVPSDGSD